MMLRPRLTALACAVVLAIILGVVYAKAYGTCIAASVMIDNAKKLLNTTYNFALANNLTLDPHFRTLFTEANKLLEEAKTYLTENKCIDALRYSVVALKTARKVYVISILLTRNATSKAIEKITNTTLAFIDRWINKTTQNLNKTLAKNVTNRVREAWRNMCRCLRECRHRCRANISCLITCTRSCEYNTLKNLTNSTAPVVEGRVRRFIRHLISRINKTAIGTIPPSWAHHKWLNLSNIEVIRKALNRILERLNVVVQRLKMLEDMINKTLSYKLRIIRIEKHIENTIRMLNRTRLLIVDVLEKLKEISKRIRHQVVIPPKPSEHAPSLPKMPHNISLPVKIPPSIGNKTIMQISTVSKIHGRPVYQYPAGGKYSIKTYSRR